MFGCCRFAMGREYYVDFGDKPDLDVLKQDYGGVITLEERPNPLNPNYPPNPYHNPVKWVMVSPGKEEDVCTCPCHVRNGPAIMC